MTATRTPPFRPDHVGSLLRPRALLVARDAHGKGEIGDAELRAVEDDCIRGVVRLQEEAGLRGITDGEYRRSFWHLDFLRQIDGVEITEGNFVARFQKDDGSEVGFKPPTMTVTKRLDRVRDIQARDFEFLKSVVGRTPKVCIPSPSMLHFRGGRKAISEEAYPDMDGFFMEYDDDRSGDFAPLRFLPEGKTVVLGIVTSKHPALESADALKRRIDEAARFAPLEQLAVSPQCGFSSTVDGNDLTVDDQLAKLRRVVEVAEDVWGG